MEVNIKIRVKPYGTDIQFDHSSGFWSLVFDDDFMVDFRSFNLEHNI